MNRAFIFVLLALSACAHSITDTYPDLVAAEKKCSSQTWDNAIASVECQDSEEVSVIERDAPVILPAFETLSSKRKLLAQKFDDETAPAKEAMNRFKQGDKDGATILAAHEPRWKDKDAILNKDIAAAASPGACKSQNFLDRSKCFDNITRPIWQRDAPDTMEYYDEFQKNRFRFAKEYDDSGAPQIVAPAIKRFNEGKKEMVSEFWANARQAVQQKQVADASASAEDAQDTAQLISFIGELAQAFLQGAAIGEQAKANTAPTIAVQQQSQITHTTCRMNELFRQLECTNTPY